jgi:hypothetical protein
MPTQIRLLAATQLYPRLIRRRYRLCATRLESLLNPQLALGKISTGCRRRRKSNVLPHQVEIDSHRLAWPRRVPHDPGTIG